MVIKVKIHFSNEQVNALAERVFQDALQRIGKEHFKELVDLLDPSDPHIEAAARLAYRTYNPTTGQYLSVRFPRPPKRGASE